MNLNILKTPLVPWIGDIPTQQWATCYDLKKASSSSISLRQIWFHLRTHDPIHINRVPRHVQMFDEGTLTTMPNSDITNNNVVPADIKVLINGARAL
jgi:hypothetical protein